MKKKAFDFSAFAVGLIIIAILFSACTISNNIDSDENTTNSESISNEGTTEPESTTDPEDTTDDINVNNNDEDRKLSYTECFVAPDDPKYIELFGSEECAPGYLYINKDYCGEYSLLLAKKIKYQNFAEMKDFVYVITEDNEVVKVNKNDGSYEAVYKAQYGSIYRISLYDFEGQYIFFNDGNNIFRLDPANDEYKFITKVDKELDMIIAGGNVEKVDDSVYCDICGDGKEYFLIIDTDYNYYWYHPETDNFELIDDDYLYYKSVEWNA